MDGIVIIFLSLSPFFILFYLSQIFHNIIYLSCSSILFSPACIKICIFSLRSNMVVNKHNAPFLSICLSVDSVSMCMYTIHQNVHFIPILSLYYLPLLYLLPIALHINMIDIAECIYITMYQWCVQYVLLKMNRRKNIHPSGRCISYESNTRRFKIAS